MILLTGAMSFSKSCEICRESSTWQFAAKQRIEVRAHIFWWQRLGTLVT